MDTQTKIKQLDAFIERTLMQGDFNRAIGAIQGAEIVLPAIEDFLSFIDEYPTEFLGFLAELGVHYND